MAGANFQGNLLLFEAPLSFWLMHLPHELVAALFSALAC